MELLRRERGLPGTYIIQGVRSGSALSKSSAERLWVELMLECDMVEAVTVVKKYAVSDLRNKWTPIITAHTLRHNFVTMCWERGIDVFTTSKLVGHSDVTTTQKIYTHLTETMQRKAAQRLNEMFDNVPKLERPESRPEKVVRIG